MSTRLVCTAQTYQSVSHRGKRLIQKHFVPGDVVDWPEGVPFPKGYFMEADYSETPLSAKEVEEMRRVLKKAKGDEPAPSAAPADIPENMPGYASLDRKTKNELAGILTNLGVRLSDVGGTTKRDLIVKILDRRAELEEPAGEAEQKPEE